MGARRPLGMCARRDQCSRAPQRGLAPQHVGTQKERREATQINVTMQQGAKRNSEGTDSATQTLRRVVCLDVFLIHALRQESRERGQLTQIHAIPHPYLLKSL